jgi:hypothetical protein
MGLKKRTEITVKVRQTLVVRSSRGRVAAWCTECARQSQMLTPDEVAAISRTGTRWIYSQVEEGKLHFTETEDGLLLICLASLQAVMEEKDHVSH